MANIRISRHKTTAASPTGPVVVRAFQLIVTVRLRVGNHVSGGFPAVLDTGHSHNISISEALRRAWTGLSLPLVSLRALVQNRLRVLIEGDEVTILVRPGAKTALRFIPDFAIPTALCANPNDWHACRGLQFTKQAGFGGQVARCFAQIPDFM